MAIKPLLRFGALPLHEQCVPICVPQEAPKCLAGTQQLHKEKHVVKQRRQVGTHFLQQSSELTRWVEAEHTDMSSISSMAEAG